MSRYVVDANWKPFYTLKEGVGNQWGVLVTALASWGMVSKTTSHLLSHPLRYRVAYNKESGECKLEISMTFADDAGEYFVYVKNPHGEVSASASLLEEGTAVAAETRSTVLNGVEHVNQCLVFLWFLSVSTELYEAYMKQQDMTYKTEVVTMTTAVQEPAVLVTQYELEQHQVAAPSVTYVKTEKVCFTQDWQESFMSLLLLCGPIIRNQTSTFAMQELHVSTFEEQIIQEVELRIMRISYTELVMEDGEQVTTELVVEGRTVQPAFQTSLKNYRIVEGMGVTFHCRMAGTPLPKVHTLLPRNGDFLAYCF